MYGYYGYYSYDLLYLALIAVFILGLVAQGRVKRTFNTYSRRPSASGIPAGEMARRMLRDGGSGAQVAEIPGSLTDNFNPRTGVVSLSQGVYGSSSIAALAVAAHEIGHVMQHQEGYLPIKLRNAILPAASFGSNAAPFIVILGLLMGSYSLAMAGVWLFAAILLFQLITLPVEFNASRRAIAMLEEGGYISYDQRPEARRVLNAAAMTYVVAALSALISFLRLFLMASSTRRRN